MYVRPKNYTGAKKPDNCFKRNIPRAYCRYVSCRSEEWGITEKSTFKYMQIMLNTGWGDESWTACCGPAAVGGL
jgi:hypothetical protein